MLLELAATVILFFSLRTLGSTRQIACESTSVFNGYCFEKIILNALHAKIILDGSRTAIQQQLC